VTKYFLDPRWGIPTDFPAFPSAITERMIGAHLKFVAFPRLEHLALKLGRFSTVLKSYRPDDELGILTVIESVRPTAESLQRASWQRLFTIVFETVMHSSQVSK
jgi:hypothetical protein